MLRRRILTTLPVAALVLPELEPAKGPVDVLVGGPEGPHYTRREIDL